MPSVPNTFTPSTIIQSSQVNENFDAVAEVIRPTLVWSVAETLSTGTNISFAFVVPLALTIEKVYGYVKTAPTGSSILVDINVNGTSIWSADQNNRLTIAASAQTGSQTVFDTSSVQEGDIMTIDIDA